MTRILFPAVGEPFMAGDTVIGTVTGYGTAEDGRPYAEVELTPAAEGRAPIEEEDPFG